MFSRFAQILGCSHAPYAQPLLSRAHSVPGRLCHPGYATAPVVQWRDCVFKLGSSVLLLVETIIWSTPTHTHTHTYIQTPPPPPPPTHTQGGEGRDYS